MSDQKTSKAEMPTLETETPQSELVPVGLTTPFTQECFLCMNDTAVAELKGFITHQCKHDRRTCKECLQAYIKNAVETDGQVEIRCPECEQVLQHSDVKTYASIAVFERYDALLTRRAFDGIEDFYWCINPKCNSGQIHDATAGAQIFTCNSCSTKMCVAHGREWHAGETCTEHDARKKKELEDAQKLEEMATKKKEFYERHDTILQQLRASILELDAESAGQKTEEEQKAEEQQRARDALKAQEEQKFREEAKAKEEQRLKEEQKLKEVAQRAKDEIASEETIKLVTTQCPCCKAYVQKIDGCDHMTCRCDAEWCYACGADYRLIRKHGNQYHKKGCPYHM